MTIGERNGGYRNAKGKRLVALTLNFASLCLLQLFQQTSGNITHKSSPHSFKMMNPVDEETALPKKNDKNVPEETASERSSKAYNWKVVLLALGVFVLVGLVVGITVPLVRDGSSDDSSGDSSDNVDTTPTETPPIDDKNSSKIGVEPFSFFGAQPLANFDPQVITSGYASEEELAADLTNAARLLLDRVVGRNIGAPGYAIMGAGGDMGRPEFEPSVPAQPNAPEADFEGLDDGSTNKDTFGDENNDYGTDNQEEGVEEGDKVVANQNVLYTAYGDYVVRISRVVCETCVIYLSLSYSFLVLIASFQIAWSTANGDQLAQIQLPPNQDTSESGPEEKPEVPPEDVVILDGPPNRRRRRLAKSGQRKLDSIWWWPMKPWVHAMLLLDTKLVVIAGGYGTNYMYSPDHVIDSYMDTKVLIYDVSAVGTTGFDPSAGLEPLETKDLNGVFVSVRAIDSDSGGHNVHVVTSGGISYYEQLIRPFEKWSDTELQEMSDEDYVATVVQRAEEKHIPNFVNQLMNDLRIDGVMPSLTRINSFDDGDGVNLAPWVYLDGYLNTVVQVHSFHVAAGTGARRHLQDTPALTALSVSGTILPTYNPQVYATENIMIIASSGSGYSEARESMVEMTYLMSFLLVGATSEPYTIGSFLGNIINQYSMDVVLYNGVQRVLRMATTLRKAWFWGFPEPLFVDGTAEDSTSASGGGTSDGATGSGGTRRLNTEPEVWEESTTENYVVTIDIDGTDDDNDPTTASVMDLLDIK